VNVTLRARLYWLSAALSAAALAIAGVVWLRSLPLTTARLLERLPADNAPVLSVDFAALRGAGILQMLAGSAADQEPDYRAFVGKTGFNYQRDLDRALVAFAPTGKFLLLVGRFDWPRLRAYVAEQGGRCDRDLCRMQGSQPDRRISFFPLRNGLMALAVSPDPSAALRMAASAPGPALAQPAAPVWLSIPVGALRSGAELPSGTRMFARSLGDAESVTLAFGPDGRRMAAKLNVLCRTEIDAADAALELTRVTGVLRQMIARENQQPNPSDLSGVLAAGSFTTGGKRVYGYWPIERSFLENLFGVQRP